MWPEIILSRGQRYQRCESLFLAPVQQLPPPQEAPYVLLRDIAQIHRAIGLPEPGEQPRRCCECDSSSQGKPSRPMIEPRRGDAFPRLNTPLGHRWIYISPGLRSSAVSHSGLPVYRAQSGLFAVDPRRLYFFRPRDGKLDFEMLELEAVRVLDLDRLMGRDPSGRRPRFDLCWVPLYSPAAGELEPGWHRAYIGALSVSTKPAGDASTVLGAVIDAGINFDHADFYGTSDGRGQEVAWSSITLLTPLSNAASTRVAIRAEIAADEIYAETHGTRVTGVIVAKEGPVSLSAGDAVGVAPRRRVRCFDTDWSTGAIKAALREVVNDPNIGVLNMSFAYYEDDRAEGQAAIPGDSPDSDADEIDELLYEAHERGVVLVAAAGNYPDRERDTAIGWPAQNPHVIAVGAIDDQGLRCGSPKTMQSWSSRFRPLARRGYTRGVSVVAPGSGILTTTGWSSEITDRFGGTSAAAPQVAALAMLLREKHTNLTPREVRRIIESTARKLENYEFTWRSPGDPSTYNDEVGHGCIDVAAALSLADVAIAEPRHVAIATSEQGALTIRVTVSNLGPNQPSKVFVRAWPLPSVRSAWRLTRLDVGKYRLSRPEWADPITTEFSLWPEGQTTIEVALTRSFTELPKALLVLVDAPEDIAFHNAHINGDLFAASELPYNNLMVVQLPPPGG